MPEENPIERPINLNTSIQNNNNLSNIERHIDNFYFRINRRYHNDNYRPNEHVENDINQQQQLLNQLQTTNGLVNFESQYVSNLTNDINNFDRLNNIHQINSNNNQYFDDAMDRDSDNDSISSSSDSSSSSSTISSDDNDVYKRHLFNLKRDYNEMTNISSNIDTTGNNYERMDDTDDDDDDDDEDNNENENDSERVTNDHFNDNFMDTTTNSNIVNKPITETSIGRLLYSLDDEDRESVLENIFKNLEPNQHEQVRSLVLQSIEQYKEQLLNHNQTDQNSMSIESLSSSTLSNIPSLSPQPLNNSNISQLAPTKSITIHRKFILKENNNIEYFETITSSP
ncbi:hypothetical protein DLAC_04839 [Tieghemostelium lacteum]|uniref:Uncharacterized protein n=1 Tax=Tieghemostelium lacteum TaxID=361077 RepID=A0A151ZJ86_TIELA|nr:hypothetical protein DLAC_04839 [Tieghemostelium lacteum]|eukprot:KYQ93950.1 hypothetical protein DLAC_04839 [Tieghemostelium lacteum]